MQEEKKLLREAVKRYGKTSVADVPKLIECIERLPEFTSARTVALYNALPDEIPTASMLERWSELRRLVLPVVEKGTPNMLFREYTCEGDLYEGAFGIGEPREGTIIEPSEIDLMLVPGMAFDDSGVRLGRGAGFYDRYLSRPDSARIYKVGLCPPNRLVAEVPTEPHDIKMDLVLVG